jgi:hypothetical protein
LASISTAGEVIFAEANPSATQLAERAPKREFALIPDFTSSIKSGQEPNGIKLSPKQRQNRDVVEL